MLVLPAGLKLVLRLREMLLEVLPQVLLELDPPLLEALPVAEGEEVELVLLILASLLLRLLAPVLLLLGVFPHELLALLQEHVVLALLITDYLLPQRPYHLLLGVLKGSEVSLSARELIRGLFQPLVADLFLGPLLSEADAFAETRVDTLVEDAREALDCDAVFLVQRLDLLVGESPELRLARLGVWV